MAVPETPTEIFRKVIAGVIVDIALAVPIAGGGGLSVDASVPSPLPIGP